MSRLAGGELEWLIVRLEHDLDCKLEQAELDAALASYDSALAALESDLELLDGRLEIFEGLWWVVQQTQQQFDCKLDQTVLDAELAAFDAAFDTLLSDIELLDGRLNTLEISLAQELC